ncbi:hypothetical protein GCM10017673_38380 [Streptosporangium violaceochromogenes]|nr:hypothetical protein GCM10017673_38380 [Streptosporangium violaceochromogenes]
MTPRPRRVLPGRCSGTGKTRYRHRAGARLAARLHHPGERLHAYPCPDCPGFWHYGHPRYWGRVPGEICGVSPDPAYRREGAVRAAHILAGPGHTVTRCGHHWHLVPVPTP